MADTKLSNDILVSNFTKFKKRLVTYFGEDVTENLLEALGGDEAVMKAPFAHTTEQGLCFDGALCKTIINITTYALKINDLLPENKRADKASLIKVCLLHQIAKAQLYLPNTDTWQREKRGILYTYNDELEGSLRVGERSFLIAVNAGIRFNEIEYEAMRIMDKTLDDNYARWRASSLSTVVRQANEIISIISKD